MSLDVSLISKQKVYRQGGTGVFVRENGATRELSGREVAEKFPDAIVNVSEDYETNEVFSANITHNLGEMAARADIYTALWRPDEQGWTHAKDITGMLERGLRRLLRNPERFKKYNPENGWGNYDVLVEFTQKYLIACKEYPDAVIEVSR
jgi:hypothetical protein